MWTGLAFVNTTGEEKSLQIRFNTGETKRIRMTPGEHTHFTIQKLFGNDPRPDARRFACHVGFPG
jgi:hypothetical protein